MATRNRCACGKVMSRYSHECKSCHRKHMEESHAKAQAVVATGKCPQCGAGLCRNLSMAGWWQCEQYGSEDFRKDPTKPSCSWQAFTE